MTQAILSKIPLSSLKGVGPKTAEKLARLGLNSVQDMLFHLPYRYEDRTQITPLAKVVIGQYATLVVHSLGSRVVVGKRRTLNVQVQDASGRITVRFFRFSSSQTRQMAAGNRLQLYGEIKRGLNGLEMIHPEVIRLEAHEAPQLPQTLSPIYPTTEGVHQLTLSKLAKQVVSYLNEASLPELLPEDLRAGRPTLAVALRTLHFPDVQEDTEAILEHQHPAQKRLAIEELLAHQVSMLKAKEKIQQVQAVALNASGKLKKRFLQMLAFEPTQAQHRVVKEIEMDLSQPHPMMRLVQGDVGSGKTLVAALAALHAIEAGYQVAFMAPTELLAEQHAQSLSLWFNPLGIQVGRLTGKMKASERTQVIQGLANHNIQLAVGTHALFQAQVDFKQLALVIIDEQHRFGVRQRLALKEKGMLGQKQPHQLVMTATPIPRTLAMTAYADLATSVIDELPKGRTPIQTVAISDQRRDQVVARVEQVVQQEKRQAYWVCTLIDESEALQCQAAEDTADLLRQQLPNIKIGLVHGRLKAAEKEQVMGAFKAGTIDVLVATTVIEVGVDVPNASLMIIENPERLGLAQLHQLRGRVGRGSVASFCVLLYKHPLSAQASERLAVLRETNDGFLIAERDLELRGPGEFLGAKQTGLAQMKVADLQRDADLIPTVQRLAQALYQQHRPLTELLLARWIPEGDMFAQV